jgi:NAD(P)-dependent dehydrogenase (short-subunit alcohol dehydrogenase family)
MKILVVGGTGTLGKAVIKELELRHEIIVAAHTHGNIKVDITDTASIETMYKSVGSFDAVISTVGQVKFEALNKMTADDYHLGLNDKLMGQVNLVLIGQNYINSKGSFTLTSGILSKDPIRSGSSASMVNAAIDGFVLGAAIEMDKGIRINAVSPTVVTESLHKFGDYFPGFEAVPASRVALAYCKSVEGLQTGHVYKVGYC